MGHLQKLHAQAQCKYQYNFQKRYDTSDQAGVAQWIEHWPVNKRVAGLIPSQGTCLVAGQVPKRGRARGNHTLMFLSLSFSLPSSLSKNKINKILKKKKKKLSIKHNYVEVSKN